MNTLNSISKQLRLNLESLNTLVTRVHSEIDNGLSLKPSSLEMAPSYATLPSGKEVGYFIGLDLGGTNFRVIYCYLDGKGKVKVLDSLKEEIPNNIKVSSGDVLFGYISKSIKELMINNSISLEIPISVGMTFSFPVDQKAVDKGNLIRWSKGFKADDVINNDVVEVLKRSLNKNGLNNVNVTALLNDTAGTLAAGAYKYPNADISMILGTGTNICYLEKSAKVTSMKNYDKEKVIVNTEWANFNRLPKSEFDNILDSNSENPGKQTLEKMTSGRYLGELLRIIVIGLCESGELFNGSSSTYFETPFSLTTLDLVNAVTDDDMELSTINKYLSLHCGIISSLEDRILFKSIAKKVLKRSAKIAATGSYAVATWLDKKLENEHIVAVDGSLYLKVEKYRKYMDSAITKLSKGKNGNIKFVPVEDGSGIGATLISAANI